MNREPRKEDGTGLHEAVAHRVLGWLRSEEPTSLAVVLTGSYAGGTADPDSDLDVAALTRDLPLVGYRTRFESPPGGGRPLHVSAEATTVEDWLARGDEPAEWALGFPVLEEARYLWAADDGVRARLGDPPSVRRPAGAPELEDFVESAMKVKRASYLGDRLALRWWGHELGRYGATLLRPLNEEKTVGNPVEAVRGALAFPVAPPHWREDLATCLGLAAAGDEAVQNAGLRLARELLAFLREEAPDVDPQPDIGRYLADGTLERHLGAGRGRPGRSDLDDDVPPADVGRPVGRGRGGEAWPGRP